MKTIILLSLFLSSCIAHSYVECADWRFNDPSKPGWTANDGRCFGYARRWPRGKYPNYTFGNFDNVWYAWIQTPNNQSTSCAPTSNGSPYGIQTRTANILDSYAPNNADYGAMTTTTSGSLLCFTWSARNHASGGETCYDHTDPNVVCPLDINWATTPGADPTQTQLNGMRVGPRLSYQNCTAGNQPRDVNSCGGCFTVPQKNPGIYTVQWRWGLNGAMGRNNNEVYSTCIDIKIEANGATVNTQASPSSAQTPSSNSQGSSSNARSSSINRSSGQGVSSSIARTSSSRTSSTSVTSVATSRGSTQQNLTLGTTDAAQDSSASSFKLGAILTALYLLF